MKLAVLIAVALLVAGCGSKKPALPNKTNVSIPQYPGTAAPKVSFNPTYASQDWTLPAGTRPSTVYDWYVRRLHAAGWKISNRNETGIRASRRGRSISIGVRGRTLEVISS